MVESPCKDCEDRNAICHTAEYNCERYQTFAKMNAESREAIRNYTINQADIYHADAAAYHKWKYRHKRKTWH